MSEFFKSAMGYFNTAPNGSGVSGSSIASTGGYATDNEFCGQVVEIDGNKLRVKKIIAEGE